MPSDIRSFFGGKGSQDTAPKAQVIYPRFVDVMKDDANYSQ